MKYLHVLAFFIAAILLGACASIEKPDSRSGPVASTGISESAATNDHETILLVSLDDGSVVMQKIHSAADVCFKVNSDTATTCLTQGAPVIDQHTNSVIGYEMIEAQIELLAKTD